MWFYSFGRLLCCSDPRPMSTGYLVIPKKQSSESWKEDWRAKKKKNGCVTWVWVRNKQRRPSKSEIKGGLCAIILCAWMLVACVCVCVSVCVCNVGFGGYSVHWFQLGNISTKRNSSAILSIRVKYLRRLYIYNFEIWPRLKHNHQKRFEKKLKQKSIWRHMIYVCVILYMAGSTLFLISVCVCVCVFAWGRAGMWKDYIVIFFFFFFFVVVVFDKNGDIVLENEIFRWGRGYRGLVPEGGREGSWRDMEGVFFVVGSLLLVWRFIQTAFSFSMFLSLD